jgi:hypothetical protein
MQRNCTRTHDAKEPRRAECAPAGFLECALERDALVAVEAERLVGCEDGFGAVLNPERTRR